MASNKDILEAQRYNRRRLVTAFTSGTPGGRELEAKPLGRPLLVGAVLGLVLVLVAVVMGRFAPALPTGWENDTLMVVKDTGARYYAVDGVLRPVANVTSARLLADPSRFRTSEVESSALDGIPRGSGIGIAGAPDMVPARDQLRSGQWTACATPAGGTRTWIGQDPARIQDAGAALVSSDDRTYLIASGRRHLVADDRVRIAAGLDTTPVHPVAAPWLNLFTAGTELGPLEVPGAGRPADLPGRLVTAVIGSVVEVGKGTDLRRYLVTGRGEITPLTEFAYDLYQMGTGVEAGNPITATVAEISGLDSLPDPIVPSDWPVAVGDVVDAGHLACARLIEADDRPTTVLTRVPVPSDGGGVPTGVAVAGGSGALVRATSGGTLGAVSLVTDPGLAYGIEGTLVDTLARLGYTEADVHTVPAAWVALAPAGVALSTAAAQQTVKA